jgi:hypothetical protein
MPSELWSRISLLIDGWLLEKKISYNDANTLREMVRKRDSRLREAYLSCRDTESREVMDNFLKMALPGTRYSFFFAEMRKHVYRKYLVCNLYDSCSSGLHIAHIAAEMAPVAKVSYSVNSAFHKCI